MNLLIYFIFIWPIIGWIYIHLYKRIFISCIYIFIDLNSWFIIICSFDTCFCSFYIVKRLSYSRFIPPVLPPGALSTTFPSPPEKPPISLLFILSSSCFKLWMKNLNEHAVRGNTVRQFSWKYLYRKLLLVSSLLPPSGNVWNYSSTNYIKKAIWHGVYLGHLCLLLQAELPAFPGLKCRHEAVESRMSREFEML